MKINVYNQGAELLKEMEIPENIFGVEANNDLLHQVATAQLANARQVLADTKDRSEVSGGGKKPWKQKGTGRARAGSSRSPLWIGGGVTFGPTNDRNFKKKVNQKMKQKAIFMSLSDRCRNNQLAVIDNLGFAEYKTKSFNAMLSALEKKVLNTERRDVLVINDNKDDKTLFSGRNLKGVKIINLENINLLDILNHRSLVLTESGVQTLSGKYKKEAK